MKKDICIVVGWQRPEFLQICCELIQKAEGSEDLFYFFALDEGYDTKCIEVIKRFPYQHVIGRMEKKGYKLGKQSYNVLNSKMNAALHSKQYVFYVEDDIFIGKDFFKMHYEIHKQRPDIFCSIGSRCNNTAWKTTDDKNAYYMSPRPDYQSWGTCFNKNMILKYLKPHFKENYFNDPVKYCSDNFKNSIVGKFFTEQDGLTRRIVELTDLKIAYPHVPRCYHAGWYGYNRKQISKKIPYKERLKMIRNVCFSREQMKKFCKPGYFKDSQPVDLQVHFDQLYLKNCEIS